MGCTNSAVPFASAMAKKPPLLPDTMSRQGWLCSRSMTTISHTDSACVRSCLQASIPGAHGSARAVCSHAAGKEDRSCLACQRSRCATPTRSHPAPRAASCRAPARSPTDSRSSQAQKARAQLLLPLQAHIKRSPRCCPAFKSAAAHAGHANLRRPSRRMQNVQGSRFRAAKSCSTYMHTELQVAHASTRVPK